MRILIAFQEQQVFLQHFSFLTILCETVKIHIKGLRIQQHNTLLNIIK